jgi:hypothetical protein
VTVRTVLSVALAVALLAAGLPPAEAAARERTASTLEGELHAVVDAAERLAATTDPVRRGPGGARVTVTVDVPDGGWFAGDGTALVGPAACPGRAVLCYRVGDGPLHPVRADADLRTTAGTRTLDPGRHRLRLRHVPSGDAPVVLVAEV